jgi:hypothetical protein
MEADAMTDNERSWIYTMLWSAVCFAACIAIAVRNHEKTSTFVVLSFALVTMVVSALTCWKRSSKETWPQHCGLCNQDMESDADRMEWHGLGNCVNICERCTGSGVEPSPRAMGNCWPRIEQIEAARGRCQHGPVTSCYPLAINMAQKQIAPGTFAVSFEWAVVCEHPEPQEPCQHPLSAEAS